MGAGAFSVLSDFFLKISQFLGFFQERKKNGRSLFQKRTSRKERPDARQVKRTEHPAEAALQAGAVGPARPPLVAIQCKNS